MLVIYEWRIEQKKTEKKTMSGMPYTVPYFHITNDETGEKFTLKYEEFWKWANSKNLQITPRTQF
jgi:hypothetical protein